MLEALIAKGTFLARVDAQALQVIGSDAGVEPLSVGIGAFVWRASHREVERVGRDERIACAGQVRVHAGPSVVLRRLDHGGTHGVEFDIAHDGQQVAFALHQAGLEAPLP